MDGLILALLLLILFLLVMLWRGQQRLQQALVEQADGAREQAGNLFGQLEAYLSLRDRLHLDKGMPYTHQWSASPDFLKLIVEHALDNKPQTIVECSSGLTTLMLARCCQLNEQGRVVSLENGDEYAQRSRHHLERYGLEEVASVLHAPLEHLSINGRGFDWYSLAALKEERIDMLVIDGPPGFIQRHSRYPALPLLLDRLADGCVIFLDDAAREDEQAVVQMWLEEIPGLSHEYLGLERGCSVLTYQRSS